ncbi:hypothetical protein BY458DRAFT_554466 [Sporodiniella umbellata]|nr:hypothetical protein BY458DRAFT_554466 [Sporodiniella umbellata]
MESDSLFSRESSSSSDTEVAKDNKGRDRHRLEEFIMNKIQQELDPIYWPGLLSVLSSKERLTKENEEEVELDLSQLSKKELFGLLEYVESCLTKRLEKTKKAKRKRKKKRPVHKRRLLEDMLYPSDDSSSDQSGIIIFEKPEFTVLENQTLVHATSKHTLDPSSIYDTVETEEEMIDIMI